MSLAVAFTVPTKAALSALPAGVADTVFCSARTTAGDGYAGMFVWRGGDQVGNVAADPAGALWVAPDAAPTGASGAWQRIYDDYILADWFDAKANGSDDLIPLSRFFSAVMASSYRKGLLRLATYSISGELPTINVNGVEIRGAPGPSYGHDIGPLAQGTVIKRDFASGGLMLKIAPTTGPSAQMLCGVALTGVTFDCNGLADGALDARSLRYSKIDAAGFNARALALTLGVVSQLGEAISFRDNEVRWVGRQVDGVGAYGVSAKVDGNAAGNVCFNKIDFNIVQRDALGLIAGSADRNEIDAKIGFSADGAAQHSMEWRGGATPGYSCRNERYRLSAVKPAIAKGTGTYAIGAGYETSTTARPIEVWLDEGNSTPQPIVEPGAAVIVHSAQEESATPWDDWTGAITSETGTITAAPVLGYARFKRTGKTGDLSILWQVSNKNNGGGQMFLPLPAGWTARNFRALTCHDRSLGQLIKAEIDPTVNPTRIAVTTNGNSCAIDNHYYLVSGQVELV